MNDYRNLVPGDAGLELLEAVYRRRCRVRLDRGCRSTVDTAARRISDIAGGDVPVYGVNTGFGKLASTRIPPNRLRDLQRNLIRSHCCGVDEPLPAPVVRLLMVLKLNSLGRGASGVRWRLLETLEALLAHDVLPVIPRRGSVGASGDLAPLAHLTAVLIGEGEAILGGRRMPGGEALSACGIEPLVLEPKEGLAMINGTQVSTALALAGLFDAWRLAVAALVTGAMSGEAMMASDSPFHAEIHALRGHPGQADAAAFLAALTRGSGIRAAHVEGDTRVQDPYSLRCQPQVIGACLDLMRQAAKTLRIEANAVTDNPLVTSSGEVVSGGNFHAEPVAFAADQLALAIAETGAITQRRIATLVDPALNHGLPAFLSPNPGLNSGLMIAEVTTAALMSENRQRATPCSTDSTPTSANQEDHVSMACHAALRLADMNRNLSRIVGVELLAAAQGIEFRRPLRTSDLLEAVLGVVRDHIQPLDDDRVLAADIETAASLVAELVQAHPGILAATPMLQRDTGSAP